MNSPISPIGKFTIPQIAKAIGLFPVQVKRLLNGAAPCGSVIVLSKPVALYALESVPGLQSEIADCMAWDGYNDVAAFMAQDKPMFRPCNRAGEPVKLSDVHSKEITRATQWRDALRPAFDLLAANRAEWLERAVESCRLVFGQTYTERHIRELVARTQRRARRREDYERIDFYLPDKPALKADGSDESQAEDFHELGKLLLELPSKKPKSGKTLPEREARERWIRMEKQIWALVFQHHNSGVSKKRLLEALCNGWKETNLEALRKQFDYKLANGLSDRRPDAIKKRQDNGDLDSALTRQIEALSWFIPAARFFYAESNRSSAFKSRPAGSVPTAVRWTIQLPEVPAGWVNSKSLLAALEKHGFKEVPTCPKELRETIEARPFARQKIVPESIAHKIRVCNAVLAWKRSPREASLTLLSAPGSQRRHWKNGEHVMMRGGDWFGGDDSTPGIAVCVPCNEGITPTSKKFRVLLGRFQWLVFVDCRTDKILAWSYVVRPRASYRAEDIINGMGTVVRTHGIPREGFQFEGGTFNSNLVREVIHLLGCQHHRTFSPHQKSVEKVFDKVWTQLANHFPDADMGRYRNENEKNCQIYEACKQGHKDPRRHFPAVERILKAFDQAVRMHNEKPIDSEQYGLWVPDELFAADEAVATLRKFTQDKEWILSPYMVERTVKGAQVKCSVPLFEDFSVPYYFSAPELHQFNGKKVRLHFDYRLPKCVAKVVLAEPAFGFKPSHEICDAELIGETASNIRRTFGWADDDQTAGRKATQVHAQFLCRESRGVGSAGRVEYQKSEYRNGLGGAGIVERGTPLAKSNAEPTSADIVNDFIEPVDRAARLRGIQENERLNLHHLIQ